jgi:hypothetical protein
MFRESFGVSSTGTRLESESGCVKRQNEQPLNARKINFEAGTGPSTIPEVLRLLRVSEPTPTLVIIGGADRMSSEIGEKIRSLFERSIAPVLESSGTVVLTGGTDSGVMAIAGQTLSSVATLVGITPGGALFDNPSVQIQPDHHISVRTSGKTWGSETDYMVRLATALTQGARCGVVLLVNGGSVAFEEINYFVDAGWPILSVAGSGGTADDLIAHKADSRTTEYDWSGLRNADLDWIDLLGSPRDVRKKFHWYMSDDELLKSAWTYYLAFDHAAGRQQRLNRWVRSGLQVGSLLILAFVLIRVQASLPTTDVPTFLAWIGDRSGPRFLEEITVPIAVALPIALAAATALSQSISADRGWRVLRGAAETLKREIYRYRAWLVCDAAGIPVSRSGPRDLKETIDSALRRSASSGFLLTLDLTSKRGRPVDLNEGDDELAALWVASYTSHRIDGQIAYFRREGRALRTRAVSVVVAGVLLAAVSGTLASTYFAPWAAMAVLGATAVTAYLERSRLVERADRYGIASADLAEIKTEVNVRGNARLGQPEALLSVVKRTEAALERESLAWEQLVWNDVRESRMDGPDSTGSDAPSVR